MFRPTTLVTIMTTGTTEDQFGDVVENSTTIASGVPAAIMERRERVFLPNTTEPRIIHYYTGRLLYGQAVTKNNRIKDENTNEIYVIENVSSLASPVKRQPLRLDLRKVLGDQ